MSKFDFISGCPQSDADAFMAKHLSYAALKSADIDSLEKSEIISAVTGWIESGFSEDWADMCEKINALPTPCMNVYCADYVAKEIMNGGFGQAFFNSSRDFIGAAANGFRAVGYPEAADIIEKALKIHFDSEKKSAGHSLEDFLELSSDNEYIGIDNEFHAAFDSEKFAALAYKYIIRYKKYFGEQD